MAKDGDPRNRGFQKEAVSMSECPPGTSRWRQGVGVEVGHIYTQVTVQGGRRSR